MAELTATQKEMMNTLYKSYGLNSDDIFTHKNFKIITRSGIDKILAKSDISLEYEVIFTGAYPYVEKSKSDFNKATSRWSYEKIAREGFMIIVKATATKPNGKQVVTFGSASPETAESGYYAEMAEKRAMARAILKLEGAYQLGFFSEDEATEFKKSSIN